MTGKTYVLDIPWQETRILNCSFCGIMIARSYWEDDEFSDEMFCSGSCADLKRSLIEPASKEDQT